ncbi:L-2-hydroxyglutarate oxidase [Thalassoglobus polymorphus]|uniref:L-2-hydroxyglutarate oxidase LhgO n=1 Tax=Thalassoglobus polymorphus TaxID=2527994 RepID=A0A517QV10_9PLAN|nr:L-2-hydroxyglutarate oxidase [Thalassoglobus polymorphus]QDT35450.1 L-2-hydroxyglutarate oxidase LhgO [Thalassoglobus polymorphus]
MQKCDVAIVGGGIVGLATAYQLLQKSPQLSVVVLEKESEVAFHQTGHNSGVLHSGIYYRPDSLRAKNCRAGKLAMQEFCEQEDVPFELCGKVIVAVDKIEEERLKGIYERGQANGVDCEIISQSRLNEIEPHTAGIAAIHVPETGIVDYKVVAQKLAKKIREAGSNVWLNAEVTEIRHEPDQVVVVSKQGELKCSYLVTCGGLWADRVIEMSGEKAEAPIVPFRGEFFELKPEAEYLCRGLIYPVPDPAFPFLGVHFTKMISGGVECGPNAVLAFARDGYKKTNLNLRDLSSSLGHPGFLKLAASNWQTGIGEMWRSWNKHAFVKALQRLVPEIRSEHLIAAPAGVRAQAVGRDGKLLDDFVFQESERIVHVGNAPSPAATAALNIGKLVVERLNVRGV